MKTKLAILVAGFLLLFALPVLAHHSIAAEFDANKTVTLKGVVTKIDWLNPHIWIYLDVKDDSGAVVKWQCEGGPPNSLTRQGWTKDALKVGDDVTVNGLLAKDASKSCNARSVKLPNGKSVFSGSAEDGGPGAKQ